jgi:Domain of unknown function (DUF4388)
VSLAGRLEDAGLPALLQTLAESGSTGKLTLTRSDGHALLVFRAGRVIYASSGALRVPFGTILFLRGLISEKDLTAALERQHSAAPPRRLGSVLVEMGKIDEKTLRDVTRQQTELVFGEVLRWKTGFFEFQPLTVKQGGEVEVDVKDFLLADGFDPKEVLFKVLPDLEGVLPERAPPTKAPESPVEVVSPRSASASAPGPSAPSVPTPLLTAEITLRLMSYAAQIMSRGVLFHVTGQKARGMGQFGVSVPGRSANEQVKETIVPLSEASLLKDVVQRGETYRGPLARTRWNAYLVERLGGLEPPEVVAVPLRVGGHVQVVLYGDNMPEARPIGPVDALEFMVAEAAAALERAAARATEPPPREGSRARK